jgi:hypothetical protein
MDDPNIVNVTTAKTMPAVPTVTHLCSTKDTQISNTGSLVSSNNSQSTPIFPTYPMAWYLLIFITLWLFGAIAGTVIAFCYTKSFASFALFTALAPPAYILNWIVKRVFSEPETITKLRIKTKAQRPTFRLPMPYRMLWREGV